MSEDFSKLESRIVLHYAIKTLSDLHIGARETTDPVSVDNPVLKDPEGRPIVPGSSIKGIFRSEMERLLNSLFGDDQIKCNNLVVELFGGEKMERSIPKEGQSKENKKGSSSEEPPSKSYASSIKFHDAIAETKKTRIRDGVRIDRKTRKAADGGKFDLEVVPKGTLLKGTIVIENPKLGDSQYAKLGAFLATMRFFNATNKSIGGSTSRGYGEVEFSVEKMMEFTRDDYISGNTEGHPLPLDKAEEFIKDWKKYIEWISGGSSGVGEVSKSVGN